jgi:hypothetical protein|tara:strand:- start:1089 stop:2321 length:1233 start_codon:yes stop_codon:yes gene_type:complete
MTNTIKRLQLYITILILSFSYNTLFAQGIIIDDESYKWIAELPKPVKSRSILPSSASLENYAPSVIDQTGTSMCASFALSTIHTINYAKNNNITNIEEIDKIRFSPSFLYYLFNDENTKGMSPLLGLGFMSKFGLPFTADVEENIFFPFGEKTIDKCYPYNKNDLLKDIKTGSQYVLDINSIKSCGESKEIGKQKIFIVNHDILRSELSAGNPCLIGASFGPDFFEKEQEFCYSETEGKSVGIGHAMVVVAYDDDKYGGSYKILNSYGKDWGCDGYTWIKYKDLTLLDGYIISFNGKDTYKESDKKEIDNLLNEIFVESDRTMKFIDECQEEELNNNSDDTYDQVVNLCKTEIAPKYYFQDKKEADEFCSCFLISLIAEYYVATLFQEETTEERINELSNDCYIEFLNKE